MAERKRNKSQAFTNRKKTLLKNNPVCWICGEAIDLTLKYPDPMSGTLDHITPVSRGGTDFASNLKPAHARCNIKRQDKDATEVAPLNTSRDW